MIITVMLLIMTQGDIQEYRCNMTVVLRAVADLDGVLSEKSHSAINEIMAKYAPKFNSIPSKTDPDYSRLTVELERELGAEIARQINEPESQLLFAKISASQGYFSLSDWHVAKYLSLSEIQKSKIGRLSDEFLGSITLLTKTSKQVPPVIYDEIFKICDEKTYPAFKENIQNALSESQRSRLDILLKGVDQQKVCMTKVITVVDAELNRQRILKLRAARPPNLKMYFNTNPILILGVDELLAELQIVGAQKEKLLALYAECMNQCKSLQDSYNKSLSQDDTSDRYIKSAMLLSAEIKRRLSDILDNSQQVRVKQVFAQVIGPKLAFSGDYKQIIGIRAEQEQNLAAFLASVRSGFMSTHGNPSSSAESIAKYNQYSNELMVSVYFDEGQRANWKKVIGTPIDPQLLQKLSTVYYGHIPLITASPGR